MGRRRQATARRRHCVPTYHETQSKIASRSLVAASAANRSKNLASWLKSIRPAYCPDHAPRAGSFVKQITVCAGAVPPDAPFRTHLASKIWHATEAILGSSSPQLPPQQEAKLGEAKSVERRPAMTHLKRAPRSAPGLVRMVRTWRSSRDTSTTFSSRMRMSTTGLSSTPPRGRSARPVGCRRLYATSRTS